LSKIGNFIKKKKRKKGEKEKYKKMLKIIDLT